MTLSDVCTLLCLIGGTIALTFNISWTIFKMISKKK